jgi:3-hydroxyisobutyrate dehydrogenase-like beta-hydroxyacid dehydrogenase
MRVAFIGAGLMGAPMVSNLIEAGHDVVVRSRVPDRLADTGWTVVADIALAVDGAAVVCSVLPDSPEVRAAIDDATGCLQPGAVWLDMSTISPAAARSHQNILHDQGVAYLDAPVSGGPTGAAEGTLAIWVGGDEEAFERVLPLLSVLGRPDAITRVGDSGAGQVVKAVNNYLAAANMAIAAEGMAMAQAAGVDPHVVRDMVLEGSGGSWQLDRAIPKLLAGDLNPGFRLAHSIKDLRIGRALLDGAGLGMPLNRSVLDRFEQALAVYGPDADWGAAGALAVGETEID